MTATIAERNFTIRRALVLYADQLNRIRAVEDRILPQSVHFAIAEEQERIQDLIEEIDTAARDERNIASLTK